MCSRFLISGKSVFAINSILSIFADSFDFCIFIVSQIAVLLFGSDLGGYSYGDFLVAVLVVSVFVTTLVISFRGAGGSLSSVVRPPRASKRSGGSK